MDTSEVESLVEDLGGNIDDLEEALAPILKTALSASAGKLPLLDKAKLYVLATYAIESILFSALRLNGVDAKSHPVFQELNRVKDYFAKIKTAETGPIKRSTTVDKEAAGRFIKHGLAGNDKYDRERQERVAREKAGAKRKLGDMNTGTHTRFDGSAKRIRAADEAVPVVQAGDLEDGDEDDAELKQVSSELSAAEQEKLAKKAAKRQRRAEARDAKWSQVPGSLAQQNTPPGDLAEDDGRTAPRPSVVAAQRGPKSNSEIFQALQQGPLPQVGDKKSKKKKRKSRGQMNQDLEDARAAEMK